MKRKLFGLIVGTICLCAVSFFACHLVVSSYKYKQSFEQKANCVVIDGVTYDKKGRKQ